MRISLDFDGVINSWDFDPANPKDIYPKDSDTDPRNGLVNLLAYLKEEGHDVWVVSARSTEYGANIPKVLGEWGLTNYFSRVVWNVEDKATFCSSNNIDIHVDDHPKFTEHFESVDTNLLHFGPNGNKAYKDMESLLRVIQLVDIFSDSY